MNTSPLIKIIIPFMIGIICGIYCPFLESAYSLYATIILFGLMVFLTFYQAKVRIFQNNTTLYPLLLFCLLVLLGYGYTVCKTAYSNKDMIFGFLEKENFCEAFVDEMPVESKKSVKTVVRIQKIKDSSGWHKVSAKVILYLQKDSFSLNMKYGDQLLLLVSLKEVEPPKNPYEFDYKSYLKNKHILYQGYIRSGEWICLTKGKIRNLYSFAYGLREKLLQSFKNENLGQKESAIASAILLGWDKDIDAETLQSYSSAGITHILSVSGLHVGVLCLLTSYLLFPLKTAKQKIIKAVFQLIILWGFAFVTGLAPPVLRASIMYSFIISGQVINRKTNVFNNLAASALFLFIIDPLVIINVGFQLSYAGLLGIVAIQPVFARLGSSKYKILNYVFELMSVSIAAQLTTMPFTLYYFHQFPTYFLLSNVVVVPFSGILLGTTLIVALFSWVPLFGKLVLIALSFEIKTMNAFVCWIEALPESSITDIGFTFIHAILLSCIVFLLSLTFIKKNPKTLIAGLFCICLFLGYELRNIYLHKKQKIWTIYNLGKRHTVIEFTMGEKAFLLGDSSFLQDENLQKFHIKNNQALNKIKQVNPVFMSDTLVIKAGLFFKHSNFIRFGDDKILLMNKETSKYRSRHILKINYIVLFENPVISIKELSNCFQFDKLIITASNSDKNIKKWIRECEQLRLPYISVDSTGFFIKAVK